MMRIFILCLLASANLNAQTILKEYKTEGGIVIHAGDSIKLAERPPFVHVYPRTGVDVALRERYLYALEHSLPGTTLPIVRLIEIGRKKTRRAVAVIESKGASTYVNVEYYVEIEKAINTGEAAISTSR